MKNRKPAWIIFFLTAFLAVPAGSFPLKTQDITLKVVTEIANIRSQPDIGSSILYQAEQGSILEYLESSGEWFQVRVQTKEGKTLTGFVHESLVIELVPIPAETPPEKKKQEETEKIEPPKVKIIPPEKREPAETPPRKTEWIPFYLSLKGGFHYSRSGEINQGAQGLAGFYQSQYNAPDPIDPDPHHVNYLFGAEVSFPLSSRVYLGMGADCYSGETGTELEFGPSHNLTQVTTRPGLRALPLRLFADYFVFPFLYIRGGVEYYFASCRYFYRFSRGEYWQEWEGQAEAQAPGVLAGLGFTRPLTSFLDIFIEAIGRYARISEFKGTDQYQDSTGVSSEENGYLYLYQAQAGPEEKYPLLFIRDRKPSEAGVVNAQRAEVDFSGITFVFGLKLRF